MTTHVILGSNGVVGRETIAALRAGGHSVRAVSRTPSSDPEVPHIAADLRDAASAARALQGADVAYLTVGLPYSTRVWRRDWPMVLRNVIDGCLANGTHLVYFDNVYAYGRVDAPMTESTPIRPSSRKGEVRAGLLRMLDTARDEHGLGVTVGRAADFYGPGASTSAFNMFAIDRVIAGKPPTWLFDASQPHSMTYTPDIGAALAVLGTDDRARGRIWHLPTAPALTGEQYLALATGDRLGPPHDVDRHDAVRRTLLERRPRDPRDGLPVHRAVRVRLDRVRAHVRGRADAVRRGHRGVIGSATPAARTAAPRVTRRASRAPSTASRRRARARRWCWGRGCRCREPGSGRSRRPRRRRSGTP